MKKNKEKIEQNNKLLKELDEKNKESRKSKIILIFYCN